MEFEISMIILLVLCIAVIPPSIILKTKRKMRGV